MAVHMLTTVDNPYDPFSEYDQWFAFDTRAGYHSMALLARVASTSHELSSADHELALETAVMEIAQMNVSGVHRAVQEGEIKSK